MNRVNGLAHLIMGAQVYPIDPYLERSPGRAYVDIDALSSVRIG
jgi:hypothetical protein